MLSNRRQFLKTTAVTTAGLGLGDLGLLDRLPRVSAAEAAVPPRVVRFSAEIEPLVRLLEETSRERLLEEIASRIHSGLSYREVLTALLLAGVRNIQPRPVGFKFHSVLVVNSAHLASLSSPDSDRWLPIFWALDYFKSAQAQNIHEGDWTMATTDDAKVPSADKARKAFTEAMDNWDEAAADAAVTGLARTAGAQEIFEIFCRYGARDFREIGHKAIYVANSWRTLQAIGWQHAEAVLRSLAYALLDRGGDPNPAQADLAADRPWRHNQSAVGTIRPDWLDGQPSSSASTELLHALRQASPDEASAKVTDLLNRGVAPQSIWDGIFDAAGELLMRRPGILSLHALTSTNALHYAFQNSANDETRRLLLLQNASFLTLFRGGGNDLKPLQLDELRPANESGARSPTLEEIFADISHDRLAAASKTLAWLEQNPTPTEFITAARRLVFLKGNNAHDYKFSSAVLEDYLNVSPTWRGRYLAASVFNLRGSGDPDNELAKRTRAALGA
ncbi:MAG: twin-arginine translocation signal domain-containing protein [Limisphaerales bacterium]